MNDKKETSVFVIAGGSGLKVSDTIKNKTSKETLRPFAVECFKELGDSENLLAEFEKQDSYAIWGMSGNGGVKPTALNKDDIVFFSNEQCLVYIARFFFYFEDDTLNDDLWYGQRNWPNKIVFKDVNRIFIPDEVQQTKGINGLARVHEIPLAEIQAIASLFERKIGWRYIFGNKKAGNIEGYYRVSLNKDKPDERLLTEEIINRFEWYCMASKFECIRDEG